MKNPLSQIDGNTINLPQDEGISYQDAYTSCPNCDCQQQHLCMNCDASITKEQCTNNDGYCSFCASQNQGDSNE